MVIAIYQDGNHVKIPDLDSSTQLPGTFHLFSLGETFDIGKSNGISYYDVNKKVTNFKLGNLELIGVEQNRDGFRFSIYDNQSGKIIKYQARSNIIEYGLSACVKQIVDASKYPTFEIYESIKELDKYKAEVKSLKEQLQALQTENKSLLSKIEIIEKSK